MKSLIIKLSLCISVILLSASMLHAREIEYNNNEVTVYVSPGEPTQIEFPDTVKGGFKKSPSNVSMDKKGNKLIVFGKEALGNSGEGIIVTLQNQSTYSVRIKQKNDTNPRDAIVSIVDGSELDYRYQEEQDPPYKEQVFGYAPSNTVSGLMREMVLAMEFGKNKIPGYRVSTRHSGEVILDDGTMITTIDRIFIGANHWGYVLNTQNMLDSSQQLNPASFRVDGTRAVMAQRWELSPRPLNAEQQLAGKDRAKVYVVTRAK